MIKRILFIAIVLLTGIASMQGQTLKLKVSDVTMPQNQNAQVTVGCELDKVYAVFQFDVILKKNGVVTSDLSIDVNSVKKTFESVHDLKCNYNAEEEKYVFVLASISNADVPSSLMMPHNFLNYA